MTAARSKRGVAVSEGRKLQPTMDNLQVDAFRPADFMEMAHKHQLFPSHPWNVRAAIETIGALIFPTWPAIPAGTVVYDPCAGLGHMVVPLREYFPDVRGSDIYDWGKGFPIADAMTFEADAGDVESVAIFNPPFDGELGDMAEKMVYQAQKTCRHVIVLQRLSFICTVGRYPLHQANPIGNLKHFLPCTERCPMRLGEYDPKCNKPLEHAWFHFERGWTGNYTGINLKPGARARLYRQSDLLI
ncbi:hypothetical protein [Asticcacaulis solisilvae]|uniref:hypothetical protein n=1 Tax=Asticcacaulis solisilvae TaxID=1217274 RepID=UPI003FD8D772